MEKIQGIEMKCGTCQGTQHLFTPQHTEAEARVLAEMMDGTSFYMYPPKADRSDCLPGSLGRCGACATAEPQRTGVFRCTLFGYAERAPAKVIQLATRVQVGDLPVSGMVLPEITSPFAISESAVKAGIDMEVKVVDVPEIVDAVNKSGVPVGALTSDPMMVTRATTDGKPPRPGFENAPTPAPYKENGQAEAYWVLSPEERAKGFVRPVRMSYQHVGSSGPKYPLRDLNEEEMARGWNEPDIGYVKFEEYPKVADAKWVNVVGRYWTQAELDAVGKGCGTVTTMSRAIAETYARQPNYYGSTFCCGCLKHLPVGERGEFIWVLGDNQHVADERVGT